MKKISVLILLLSLGLASVNAQISFENHASQLEINEAYGFGFLGGGVSFFGYTGDGWDDLTLSSASGEDFFFIAIIMVY